jgi:hypothetical protein
MIGNEFTVTVTVAGVIRLLHAFALVPVTLYTVVVVGLAVGVAVFAPVNVAVGVQVYVLAPLTENV